VISTTRGQRRRGYKKPKEAGSTTKLAGIGKTRILLEKADLRKAHGLDEQSSTERKR